MSVGVVGAGTMGRGIAHAFALAGHEVTIVEPVAAQREAAISQIATVLAGGVRRGKVSEDDAAAANARLTAVAAITDLPEGLDVVIEAVSELPALKHEVLTGIEARRPALIGSNTSALSITELAAGLASPQTFIGMHFFNPVWSMRLLELVVGRDTAPETVARAQELATTIGKEAIVVQDAPGFASSRLGILLGLEAIRMVESGVATPADIDTAMVLGYGHPMGPLRLGDLVGLDVRLDIARNLQQAYGDRFAPPALLETMVAEGKLGQKSGQGFYTWS